MRYFGTARVITTVVAWTLLLHHGSELTLPAQTPGSDALVAAYGFNEGSGTNTADSSGNFLNGTLTGAAWSGSGKYGGAITFDGAGDWVTITSSPLLNLPTNLTVQAWVYPTTLAGWRTVLLKERPSGLSYALYADNNTSRPGFYGNNGAPSSLSAPGTAALPLNTWTHLAGTYSNGVLRLYTNGLLAGTQALSGSIVTTSNPLRIGGNSVWGEYFIGRIDEVRIHKRALTQSEIQSLMTIPVAEDPGFKIIIYNNPVALGLSDSGTFDLGIAPSGGFTAQLYPTVSGLPPNTTGIFEPVNLTHPGPFALNIATSATTPAGTYPLTVTCTNGALSATTNLTLTVTTNADFRISVEPNQLTLSQGQTGFANFEVRSENGYSQSVSLTATGLPAGVSTVFTPSALAPTGSGTVQFHVGPVTPIGVYPVLLTATDGTLTHQASFTLVVQVADPGGTWSQLSLGDANVTYYGVIVGDVGGTGTNRVYGSAGGGLMYEYRYSGSTWSFSQMPVGVPADGQMHNMAIGPGRGDGVNRLYIAAAGSGKVYELSWVNDAWQAATVTTLNGCTDIIIGNGRNDGVTRMYICWLAGTTEFTWNGSDWTALTMSSNETGYVHGIDLGVGRNDGTNHIYTANQGNGEAYEYTWTGSTWTKLFIGDVVDARNIEVGQGRNDGVSRVYVPSGEGNAYEFTWTNSAWQGISIGNAGIADVKVQSIPAKARSDNLVRIYVTGGSGMYEYNWNGSVWETVHLGSAVAYMYGAAAGDGMNKGTTQVYGSSYDGNVYLFEWIPTTVPVPGVAGQTQAAATTTITNAGLTEGLITTVSSATIPAGTVISQNPIAGTQVSPGSAVSLVISSGPAPVITSVVVVDGNLVFSGTNGSGNGGGSFYVCSSTNVAAPLASWTRETTNTYASGGTFSVTNAISPNSPQKYYLLDQP